MILESAGAYHKAGKALPAAQRQTPALLVFSANHLASLQKGIEKYREFLSNNSVLLKDVAYTLGAHREHMLHKAFAIVSGTSFEVSPITKSNSTMRPGFVFTGQGAQWPEMGRELMEDYDTFRADIKAMDASLSQLKQAPPWKLEGLDRFHTTAHDQSSDTLQMSCAKLGFRT